MKSIFPLMTILSLGLSAQARDLYHFHPLGFSSDGSRYAFAQTVINDGSGFASANIKIIMVDTNTEVVNKNTTLEQDGSTEDQALQQAIKDIDLVSYNIVEGNFADTLLTRETTDRSTYTNTRFGADYHHDFDLTVDSTPITTSSQCLTSPELLKLTLTSADPLTPLTAVLQNDVTVAAGRECGSGYRVSRVIRNGDRLVVIMSFASPGFEGQNVSFFAIGAAIKLL